MTMREPEFGDVVACPTCLAACRIGSEHHKSAGGRCQRCNEVLTQAAAARAMDRARYSIEEQRPVLRRKLKGDDPTGVPSQLSVARAEPRAVDDEAESVEYEVAGDEVICYPFAHCEHLLRPTLDHERRGGEDVEWVRICAKGCGHKIGRDKGVVF